MSPTPFYIVNAFTADPYGGNPAVVVILQEFPDDTILQGIAKNFNQPMVSFVRFMKHDGRTAFFEIRWFSVAFEVPLCGHGTVAAASAIFSIPDFIPSSISSLRFQSPTGRVLTARKVGEWIEVALSAGTVKPLPQEEAMRLQDVVSKGLGKDISLKFVGSGGEGFEHCLLAEIDEADDLAGCKPEPTAFLSTGYAVNIITSSSPDPNFAFLSRMFAPAAGAPEDHVCGSAHGLMGPYWSQKRGGETDMIAKQVSERSGVLKIGWNQDENLLTLGGQTVIVAKGEIVTL